MKMYSYRASIAVMLIWVMAILVCLYGYFSNIMLLIDSVMKNNYSDNIGILVLRIVGVFTGVIGVIMGFIT